MKETLLHIEHLAIGRELPLFENISLSVNDPGLVLLSGSNGIGKSTLLKTITGLIPPISGTIRIKDQEVKPEFRKALSRLVAYVNTDRIRDEYISVIDLVRYGQFPYLSQDNSLLSEKILDEAMDMLGLNLISGKYLNNISDGEWQKANIARALAQNTPIIVMDEPSAFLDYPSKIKLFSDLRRIAEEKGKLIICSTHDIEIANRYGHVFWHMDQNGFSTGEKAPVWV